MDNSSFSKYLEERYNKELNWYDQRADRNQLTYKTLQWILIILSAITPVLIEINATVINGEMIGQTALITSLIVAILTSALKTFRYQENWINYRSTCEALRKEIYYYEAGLGEYRSATDKEALFVDRVEMLISRENMLWTNIHKKIDQNSSQSKQKAV